jgi:hypothetical protein
LACDELAPMVVRSLITFYIVTFSANLIKNADLVYRADRLQLKIIQFPMETLRNIPIKYILSYTESERSLRQLLYPSFISAVSYILPELLIFDTIPMQMSKFTKKVEKTELAIDSLILEFENCMSRKGIGF